jgi:hypothetical protein
MAKDDYRFSTAQAYLAWVQTRPKGEEWHYIDGYAIMLDGLWDGEHWRAPPRESAAGMLRKRIARAFTTMRRPDFSTPEKFLDWSSRKRDDP